MRTLGADGTYAATCLRTFWPPGEKTEWQRGKETHWGTALWKGRGVREVCIRGLQQMAVKAKSGMQISSGPRSQGQRRKGNHPFFALLQESHTGFPAEACIPLNQENRKPLRMTWTAARNELHCHGQHPELCLEKLLGKGINWWLTVALRSFHCYLGGSKGRFMILCATRLQCGYKSR